MDVAAKPLIDAGVPRWRLSITPFVELLVLALALAVLVTSYFVVSGNTGSQRLLTPPLVALLLVGNLIPLVALIVLVGRRSEEHTSELQSRA